VGLEQFQQFKADAHPLLRRDEFCAPIRNATDLWAWNEQKEELVKFE
jgi:hypothetical protein